MLPCCALEQSAAPPLHTRYTPATHPLYVWPVKHLLHVLRVGSVGTRLGLGWDSVGTRLGLGERPFKLMNSAKFTQAHSVPRHAADDQRRLSSRFDAGKEVPAVAAAGEPMHQAGTAADQPAQAAYRALVTGSQTGADRAALRAARAAGIRTMGIAPRGFKTERGPEPSLADDFGLQDSAGGYAAADRANVHLCDALLAFRYRVPKTGRGCESTIHFARVGTYEHVQLEWPPADTVTQLLPADGSHTAGVPVLVVWDLAADNLHAAQTAATAFLRGMHRPMVSGPCESTNPQAAGLIETLLTAVFTSWQAEPSVASSE